MAFVRDAIVRKHGLLARTGSPVFRARNEKRDLRSAAVWLVFNSASTKTSLLVSPPVVSPERQ